MWTLQAPTQSLSIYDDRSTTNDLAAFGDLTVPFGRGFAIDAGGRVFLSSVSETRTLPGGVTTYEFSHAGFTPSVSLSWRSDPTTLIYLRYGSAFREGGLDINPNGQIDRLKGDQLRTFEAGGRHSFPGGGSLNVSLYDTIWSDMQSDMLQPNGLIETRNAGKALIRGMEASLRLPLSGRWEMSLGGMIQDARLVRNDLGIALEDARLPVVPAYVARAGLEKSLSVWGRAASLRARLRYVGPAHLSFDPQIDRPMGNYLESTVEGRIQLGKWEVALKAENLFNNHADEFAFGNPLRFFTMQEYVLQRPLSATLAVRAGF